jgi:hypothetical protein
VLTCTFLMQTRPRSNHHPLVVENRKELRMRTVQIIAAIAGLLLLLV